MNMYMVETLCHLPMCPERYILVNHIIFLYVYNFINLYFIFIENISYIADTIFNRCTHTHTQMLYIFICLMFYTVYICIFVSLYIFGFVQ